MYIESARGEKVTGGVAGAPQSDAKDGKWGAPLSLDSAEGRDEWLTCWGQDMTAGRRAQMEVAENGIRQLTHTVKQAISDDDIIGRIDLHVAKDLA